MLLEGVVAIFPSSYFSRTEEANGVVGELWGGIEVETGSGKL